MVGMRVLDHLIHRGDGAAGHTEADQPFGQLATIVRRQVVLQGLLEGLAVDRALAVVGKTGIVQQRLGAEVFA
ncbi:hypothetical protein D3C85_1426250 [compost metagenome]